MIDQATGCGKTHTISGTAHDPGIIYQTMAELFQRIEDRKDDILVDVSVTFLEIYNEEIHDLLSEDASYRPKGGLAIREDKTVKIVGLTELSPKHADEVKAIVQAGNARRTQSPTHANETSSRSHAVLQIHVSQSPRTASTVESRTMATLSIIDLAGSERACATRNMGQRMLEGANINKSLLALGNCINALCESGTRTRHIPYRNSKLTRLLKFSLGGNCKTVMIVCVAPTSQHFEDTLNTLQYADRAKMIRTKVSRNLINVDRHVAQYVEAINRLNEEVRELKSKLAGKAGQESDVTKRKATEAKAEVERVKSDLQAKANLLRNQVKAAGDSEGQLVAVTAQLEAAKKRMAEIEARGQVASSLADVAAERGLLNAIVGLYDPMVAPNSHIHQAIQRGGNTNSTFDAMLRAVSERRTDRLDETNMDTIRLYMQAQRAEIERVKAEAERDALRRLFANQTTVLTSFVGLVARCTVMMRDAGNILSTPVDPTMVQSVAQRLGGVADSNDQSFRKLLDLSIDSFAVPGPSSLRSFSGQQVPAAAAPKTTVTRVKARNLSTGPGSPARRRLSATRALIVPKKAFRWADEAGEGKLSEGNSTVISVAPDAITSEPDASRSVAVNADNEWEDERPDDKKAPSMRLGSASRRRSSRLLPPLVGKLKSGIPMGSLLEHDDNSDVLPVPKRPFADRHNNPFTTDEHGKLAAKAAMLGEADDDNIPLQDDLKPSHSSGRRRSILAPMRLEKARRRSSLIPVPSPTSGSTAHGSGRRISVTKSPAKRKQISLSRFSAAISKGQTYNMSLDLSERGSSRRTWR